MSDRIDTDQLLDRCADCGARARIIQFREERDLFKLIGIPLVDPTKRNL